MTIGMGIRKMSIWLRILAIFSGNPNYMLEDKKMTLDPDFDIKEPEFDYDKPIGEKPWPLRLAIPAILKNIGRGYMSLCTIFTTLLAILYLLDVI